MCTVRWGPGCRSTCTGWRWQRSSAGVPFEEGKTVPIRYRGLVLVTGLELDLVVGGEVIVETLSVERITDWHCARLLTHLRLSGCGRGLLINFGAEDLEKGVRRMILRGPGKPS